VRPNISAEEIPATPAEPSMAMLDVDNVARFEDVRPAFAIGLALML
jgi:hypothetical protein